MRTPESLHGVERTLVLVGKTGNGKSATGNSILGRQVFDSRPSLAGVTSTCHLATTEFAEGLILNVIDTPGLFDPSVKPHAIAEEIGRCLTLAKDGIHAVLLVLSLNNRFSKEEMSAFHGLCQIFGDKIADYMIVVFGHGDMLGDQSLDSFLSDAPETLMRTLHMCGNRRVLFDNMTNDGAKISRQRQQLLSLVHDVLDNNGGIPYTIDLLDELKNGEWSEVEDDTSPQEAQMQRFQRFIMMVESRLRESIEKLEKQVEEEKAAREAAEAKVKEAEKKSKEEIEKLAAMVESTRLEAEAKVQAAREEAEKKSKEGVDKLAAAMESARLEAEAKAREAENKAKEEMHNLAAMLETARLEAEAKLQEAELKSREDHLDEAEKRRRELDEQLRQRGNCAIL